MRRLIVILAGVILFAGPAFGEEFKLTVNVVGSGKVDPNGGSYSAGEVVRIDCWPDGGMWVKSWSGTDDDTSMERTNTVTMTSNKVVTVEFGPAIVVAKPVGGDVWSAGSSHEILWSSYGAGTVDILFSEDGGGSQEAIGTGVVDSGRFMWGLPEGVDSENCVVSVVPGVPDSSVVCIDSGPFTIQPYRRRPAVPSGHTMEGKGKGPVELDEVKWQFQTDGPVTAGVGIAHNNRVHIASEDGRLYTVDADGELLWIYDANSPLVSKPAVGHFGEVYVGSEGGKLYAIDEKGKLMWTHRTGGPIYATAAISRDGKIFVGSVDGTLWALGLDGSELWSFAVDGPGLVEAGSIFASPVIADDGTVYVGGLYDPNLYALNPADGSVKWACRFEGEFEFYSPSGGEPTFISKSCWPFASPATGADGTIYQTLLYDNDLYAIDPNDGTINWATNLAGALVWRWEEHEYEIWYGIGDPPPDFGMWFGERWRHSDGWSEPVAGAEGAIYVSFDDDAFIRGVEPNGSLMWMKEVGTSGGLMMTGSSEGHIYAAAEDPNLYMIDADGEVVGQFDGGGSLNHPVIAGGRKVVVSDANNAVWMIGEDEAEEGPAEKAREKKSGKE